MATENQEQIENEAAVILEGEEDSVEVVETPDKTPEELLEESRARRQGWRPESEYHGNKANWVDAKTFNERADHELPIMRERYRKMDSQLANTEKKLGDTQKKLDEVTEVLFEVRDLSKSAEERGFQRAMAEFSTRELAAVRNADEAEWARIQHEKQVLQEARPKPKAPVAPAASTAPEQPQQPFANPIVQQWIADNKDWYTTSPSMQAYANEMDAEIEREFSHWPTLDKLAEVKRRTMERFPEKFPGMTQARRPTPVTTPSVAAPPARKAKGKTVADLPADAKAALARIKRQMPDYKDEEYLSLYFKDEQ